MFNALGHLFKQIFGSSRPDQPEMASLPQSESNSQMAEQFDSIDAANHLVPYDENLLERARTQWQFGDWHSLAQLNRDTLQHHPERAKLVLLAAAGRLQIGLKAEARQYIRLAQDWGCSKKHISQILISGVHNSIGMAAAIGDQHQRAAHHFENAIRVGSPNSDLQLLAQARTAHQVSKFEQIGFRTIVAPAPCLQNIPSSKIINSKIEQISENFDSPSDWEKKDTDFTLEETNNVDCLFKASLSIGSQATTQLHFNSKSKGVFETTHGFVKFESPNNTPAYLVSNEVGDFEIAPTHNSLSLQPNKAYEFTGIVVCDVTNPPVVWVFEFDLNNKKINSHSYPTQKGEFRAIFKTQTNSVSYVIGIRLAGTGSLDSQKTWFKFENNLAIEVAEAMQNSHSGLEKKLAELQVKLHKDQQNQNQNNLRQIESFLRLQNYCGDLMVLPDMHGWPVSPDLGFYIIRLVETGRFDGIVEFGSGVSTLLIARALQKSVNHHTSSTNIPFVSFDHLEHYLDQTQSQLLQAQLSEAVQLVHAPLIDTQSVNNNPALYYDCQDTLKQLRQSISKPNPKLLVFVDGPPASTAHLARFPAMLAIEQAFESRAEVHYLMDDYIRQDEREIVDLWQAHLERQGRQVDKQELKQFEKQACLLITKGLL